MLLIEAKLTINREPLELPDRTLTSASYHEGHSIFFFLTGLSTVKVTRDVFIAPNTVSWSYIVLELLNKVLRLSENTFAKKFSRNMKMLCEANCISCRIIRVN